MNQSNNVSEMINKTMPMPVLAGLLDCFGLSQGHVAQLIGVSQPRISRWYRGEGIEPEYLFLLTATLGLVIQAAEEGETTPELPQAARQTLKLRGEQGRQWLALQEELNKALPEEARQHARALEERLVEARRHEVR